MVWNGYQLYESSDLALESEGASEHEEDDAEEDGAGSQELDYSEDSEGS